MAGAICFLLTTEIFLERKREGGLEISRLGEGRGNIN